MAPGREKSTLQRQRLHFVKVDQVATSPPIEKTTRVDSAKQHRWVQGCRLSGFVGIRRPEASFQSRNAMHQVLSFLGEGARHDQRAGRRGNPAVRGQGSLTAEAPREPRVLVEDLLGVRAGIGFGEDGVEVLLDRRRQADGLMPFRS